MGIQRPMETVRGVINALTHGEKSADLQTRKLLTHPEWSGIDDIDLPVITTISQANGRRYRTDFYEFYWSYLMSETRAKAVLLWLFELARRGPRVNRSIRAIYWTALVILAALFISASLLAVQALVLFVGMVAKMTSFPFLEHDLHSLLYVIFGIIFISAIIGTALTGWKCAFKLTIPFVGLTVISLFIFILLSLDEHIADQIARLLVPIALATIFIAFSMGRWGLAGLSIILALSYGIGAFAAVSFFLFPKFRTR